MSANRGRSSSLALELDYVHTAYTNIAPHLSHTKHKAWPRVDKFLSELPVGALVADVGCGSGRYLSINPCAYKLGSDRCATFVQACAAQRHDVNGQPRRRDVMVCDNLALPYRDNAFDAVISIGVIHHLSSSERRGQALRQLSRVLRKGGRMMVYVWALEQNKRKFDGQDVLIPWSMQTKHMKRKDRATTINSFVHSGSYSDDDSGGSTSVRSVCGVLARRVGAAASGGLCPQLSAQTRELCNDIVNFVSGSSKTPSQTNGDSGADSGDANGMNAKFPSIFNWLNQQQQQEHVESRRSSPPIDFGKTISDAELSDVVVNDATQRSRRHSAKQPPHCSTANAVHCPNKDRPTSFSDRLKAHLTGMIGCRTSADLPKLCDNDALYRQLIDHIAKNESHIFDKPWPPVDRAIESCSLLGDASVFFKVREFPLSSFPCALPALARVQQSFETRSQEDEASLLSDDEEDLSDDVFENAQLETNLFQCAQTSSVNHEGGTRPPLSDGPVNGVERHNDVHSIITKPGIDVDVQTTNVKASHHVSAQDNHQHSIAEQNGHAAVVCTEDLVGDDPSFRRRIPTDPTEDERSLHSNGVIDLSGSSPWLQEGGYSADESSLNSSFADLCAETRMNKANQRELKVRRKPKSHLDAFLANKAHSFDSSMKGSRENGVAEAKEVTSPHVLRRCLTTAGDGAGGGSGDTDSEHVSEADDGGSAPAVYHRYYHVFKQGELVSLVQTYAPDVAIVDVYFDHGNWCVVAEKVV